MFFNAVPIKKKVDASDEIEQEKGFKARNERHRLNQHTKIRIYLLGFWVVETE